MEGFGFGILHLLPVQIRDRVSNYLAGFRVDLGTRKAGVYRKKQEAIGWQSHKQIKDREPDTDNEEEKPQDEGQWQDYNSTWWEEAKDDDSAKVSYGNWQQTTSWRHQRQESSSQSHQGDEGAAQSTTWASSSTSRASPYQETPWDERSAAWKRDDWRGKK
jgi:hypothetical protein